MVEYQDDIDRPDEAPAPKRRRRATYRPVAAAAEAGPAAPTDEPAGGTEEGRPTPPEPLPAPTEQLTAPAEPSAASAAQRAGERQDLIDDVEEQGEADVIVPPTAHSTEPADAPAAEPAAAPIGARPSLAVLFQAPPPRPDLPPLPQQSSRGPEPEPEDDQDDDEPEAGGASRRSRRRTRRRSGSSGEGGEGASTGSTTEVVAKARPAREPITEPQRLKGSTRLEAKRQRRRDGRDAGRRRTVVTEAEFLARREAVERVLIVRTNGDRVEMGVLEDGVLAEHYVAKHQNLSLIGNVYLGRVQNVLPSMEAAFVDIGRGRNAVLYSGEVDWQAAGDRLGEKGQQARRIELALKSGDQVLVQVTKDPIGHKGARLTSAVSLPGRYLVYVPNGSMSGISRKLPDTERARLKKILKDALPDSAGVIVRTAAEGATEEQLTIDVQRLANQWAEIEHLVEDASAPAMLHGEPDLLVKIVRDVFNEDFSRLVVQGEEPRATIERYLRQVAPDLLDRLEPWEGDGDVFVAHRVPEQIEKALDRKVWLPSGGSLVIDRTEAMTVIDVNTGKFVGSGGNLEETVTKNNLEAAEEIVRQLRLRDIGGIIVVDFIDMVLESNRDLVSRRLVECLSRDRTKHQVAEVTSLGLVQMTRKRLGVGLSESLSEAPAGEPKQEQGGRRRRGGNGGGGSPAPAAPRQPVTHTITDGAKTALAQIAGATIAPARTDSEAPVDAPTAVPAEPVRAEPTPTTSPVGGAHAAEVAARGPIEPAEDEPPARLLDLPVVQVERQRPPRADADGLLDAVLDHLPQPKAAGQGRRRSRRVTTSTLTAGED